MKWSQGPVSAGRILGHLDGQRGTMEDGPRMDIWFRCGTVLELPVARD